MSSAEVREEISAAAVAAVADGDSEEGDGACPTSALLEQTEDRQQKSRPEPSGIKKTRPKSLFASVRRKSRGSKEKAGFIFGTVHCF